ncbi:P44/Msp2 family outer membrane protein [Anaplasma capra]|uniref:P44/Msp2 family outer membrane protein n=2 Tax=Anaplasma capra TaxID=1562740 RepID=UPI0021D5D680|nr:P44/Msp2 family outer membrane protein [Anaplasma capra]MCU7611103.1 P44/Msp2 family outer membrane protein [Anaplasma capra]
MNTSIPKSGKILLLVSICSIITYPLCCSASRTTSLRRGNMGTHHAYLAFTTGWARSVVRDFRLGTIDGKTEGILPFGQNRNVELGAENFNWATPDPEIDFGYGEIPSVGWSIGYAAGNKRFEFGVEKRRFAAKINGESDQEGLFMLLKGLTYALAYYGHNVTRVADALENCIGCQDGLFIDSPNGWATYKVSTYGDDDAKHAAEKLAEFSSEDRLAAAKLLVGNVESGGGEVSEIVEISELEATAAMLSVCYDAPVRTLSGRVTPYVCGGAGGSLIDVSGNTIWKLAYRMRGGVSCKFTPKISLNLEAFFHSVPDRTLYRKFAVERALGDINYQSDDPVEVAFNLSYLGGNLGVRIAF